MKARDLADRSKRRAADLAHPFGDRIGHGKDLAGLLVEQEVVVAEMRPADVPVEVLRLQIEGEDVRQQDIEGFAEIAGGAFAEIAAGELSVDVRADLARFKHGSTLLRWDAGLEHGKQ